MYRLIRLTGPWTLLALCFATGCAASGNKFTPVILPTDKAVVYIYRIHKFVGAGVSWELFANGEHITRVDNGGYYAHVVDPGTVEYKQLNDITWILLDAHLLNKLLRRQEPLHTLEASAGTEYFLRWKINWGARGELVPVSKEKGLTELKGLRAFAEKRKQNGTVAP